MLIDDARRASASQLQAQAQACWESKCGAEEQGFIACAGVVELGRVVLRAGSPSLQATFVHVATNTAHLTIVAAGAADSAVVPWSCPHGPCDGASLTLAHLQDCAWRSVRRLRRKLRKAIIAALSSEPCTAVWLAANRRLMPRELLLKLFPIPASASAAERTRHLARATCGAFSRAQENAAARAVGFPSAQQGRAAFAQVRLQWLQCIHQFYGGLR